MEGSWFNFQSTRRGILILTFHSSCTINYKHAES